MALLAPVTLMAAEPDFHATYDDAYAHYREAFFHARTGNTPVAAIALEEFVVKWTALVTQFADDPPPEYANDAAWKSALQDILGRAERGLDALDEEDAETAREAIYPIRTILGDLRRRNNVTSWSDTIDALSAAMVPLARYRKSVRDMSDPATIALVREQALIVEAIFAKCRAEATPAMHADPEFKRLVDGAADSMAKLLRSLETRDSRLMRIGIGELRSSERIMFLRFG
jgi:hypothetical protein